MRVLKIASTMLFLMVLPFISGPARAQKGQSTLDRNLEQSIRRLEEQARALDAKTRKAMRQVSRLTQRIFGRKGGKPTLKLIHRNKISGAYRLMSVVFHLNKKVIFKRSATGKGGVADKAVIFDGTVPEGLHELKVRLFYKGHGYGVFTYLKKYKFTIRGRFRFRTEEGLQTTVKIVGEESGSGKSFKDRLSVKFYKSSKKSNKK